MIAWKRNLYSAWISQILSLTGFGFVLPFIPFFLQELGVQDPRELNRWVGWISAIPGLSMGLAAPFWGVLADRYGRKLMMLRAMASGTVILFLMSRAQLPSTVFVLRMFQGFLTGTVTAAATLVASGTPGNRLSSALGFLSSSTFIGMSIGPAIGGIAAEYLGYRSSFIIGSAVMLCGFLFVLLFIREPGHTPRKKEEHSSPSNKEVSSLTWKILAPLLAILFLLRCARTVPNPFLALHIQALQGRSEGVAALTGTISGLVGFVTACSGIVLGKLGDKRSKLSLMPICALLAALTALPAFLSEALEGFAFFYILSFFFAGGLEPLMQSHISSKSSPENRGLIFGIQTAVGSMGWAISPLLGSFLSIRFGLSAVFLTMSCFFLSAALISALQHLREQHKKAAA